MKPRCYYVWKWFHGCTSTNCKLTYTESLTKCFCRASWRRPSRRCMMHYYITQLRANTIKVLYVYFLQNLDRSNIKKYSSGLFISPVRLLRIIESIICVYYFRTISLDSDDIFYFVLCNIQCRVAPIYFSQMYHNILFSPYFISRTNILQNICNLTSILPYYITSKRYTDKINKKNSEWFFMSNFMCVHSFYE